MIEIKVSHVFSPLRAVVYLHDRMLQVRNIFFFSLLLSFLIFLPPTFHFFCCFFHFNFFFLLILLFVFSFGVSTSYVCVSFKFLGFPFSVCWSWGMQWFDLLLIKVQFIKICCFVVYWFFSVFDSLSEVFIDKRMNESLYNSNAK